MFGARMLATCLQKQEADFFAGGFAETPALHTCKLPNPSLPERGHGATQEERVGKEA